MLSYSNSMSNTETPRPNLAEAPTTQFLVHYRLSGAILVSSTSGQAASQTVAVSLEALFGNKETGEAWPSEASRIRVSELAVNVDAVEAISLPSLSLSRTRARNSGLAAGKPPDLSLRQAGSGNQIQAARLVVCRREPNRSAWIAKSRPQERHTAPRKPPDLAWLCPRQLKIGF